MDKASQSILDYDPLIGDSESINKLKNIISKIATLGTTVMIYGERGTGKELVARMIHENSPCAGGTFVAIRPDGSAPTLMRDTLRRIKTPPINALHHTYADAPGYDTVFINDVADLNADSQKELLSLLQRRAASFPSHTWAEQPARLIVATRQNLKKLIKNGEFRQDLFYRLNMITLEIPPLRERRDDILSLARHFWKRNSNSQIFDLHPDILAALQQYHWPGNVDELQYVLKRLGSSSEMKELFSHVHTDFAMSGHVGDVFLPHADAKALRDQHFFFSGLQQIRLKFSASASSSRGMTEKLNSRTEWNNTNFSGTPMATALSVLDCLN